MAAIYLFLSDFGENNEKHIIFNDISLFLETIKISARYFLQFLFFLFSRKKKLAHTGDNHRAAPPALPTGPYESRVYYAVL